MSRSVLVGVDSHNTAAVASTADHLGRLLGLKVALVHAIQDVGAYPYGNSAERERRRFRAERSADRLLEDAGWECRTGERQIVYGPAASSLIEASDDEDAALLVIGSRGRGPIRSTFSGSVSQEVVKRSRWPVVIVPPGMNQPRPERRGEPEAFRPSVVCGVGATDGPVDHVVAAAELCSHSGLDLVLVHVVPPRTPPESTLDRAVRSAIAAAPNGAIAIRAGIEVGTPAEELLRVAALVGAELIVVGSDRLGPLAASLLGSTSNTLANESNRPVMVVPEEVRLELTPNTTPVTAA